VQAISPFTKPGEPEQLIDLATAKPGPYMGTFVDPATKKVIDMVGQYAAQDIPVAKATSDRFVVGANFCNKLFNAARFAFLNLEGTSFRALSMAALPIEDRWILSRLQHAIETVQKSLLAYNPSAALAAARDFFWSELCDWYLEMLKPRFREGADLASAATAKQTLAAVLDQTLRLLHPFVPFLTETLWAKLAELAKQRGVDREFAPSAQLVHASWPAGNNSWRNAEVEQQIATMQQWCVALRETRARHQVPPRDRLAVRIQAEGDTVKVLSAVSPLLSHMAGLSDVTIGASVQRTADSATVVHGSSKAFLLGVVDLAKEKAKLEQQVEKLCAQIGSIEKKLGNEGFTAKAPPQVIAKERANLDALQQQLAGVEQSLRELG